MHLGHAHLDYHTITVHAMPPMETGCPADACFAQTKHDKQQRVHKGCLVVLPGTFLTAINSSRIAF